MGEGQYCLTEIFGEEKCPEVAFERRESSRVPDVLGEIVPDVGAKCEKVRKPWVLRLNRWNLSMRASDEERREREGL